MKRVSNEQFAQEVLSLAKAAEPFRPSAVYDPDGDCIEFLVKPDPFYAERIDELVTVYYSQETGEIVGSLIKGVSRLCREILQRMPGFCIEVQDGRIRLVHIFRARLWSSPCQPSSPSAQTYQKLISMAETENVEVPASPCLVSSA